MTTEWEVAVERMVELRQERDAARADAEEFKGHFHDAVARCVASRADAEAGWAMVVRFLNEHRCSSVAECQIVTDAVRALAARESDPPFIQNCPQCYGRPQGECPFCGSREVER